MFRSVKTVWKAYNTILEIEAIFLNTDLDLRPVYNKNDDATMAHLHLGSNAYWLVNTIRYQLKEKNIKSDWREIVRIVNTQKVVTTTAHNILEDVISIRRCSEPNDKGALFTKKKSVVHKLEIKKSQPPDKQKINSQ